MQRLFYFDKCFFQFVHLSNRKIKLLISDLLEKERELILKSSMAEFLTLQHVLCPASCACYNRTEMRDSLLPEPPDDGNMRE